MKNKIALGAKARRPSPHRPKTRASAKPSLSDLTRALVFEERVATNLASQIHHLPPSYAALILGGQLTNIQSAHLPQSTRLKKMFHQLDRGLVAFQTIRQRLLRLADGEFSSYAAFLKDKTAIFDGSLEYAFHRRGLYLLYGFQELDLVGDVLWPVLKQRIAGLLCVSVEVDDSVYESWLERLRATLLSDSPCLSIS